MHSLRTRDLLSTTVLSRTIREGGKRQGNHDEAVDAAILSGSTGKSPAEWRSLRADAPETLRYRASLKPIATLSLSLRGEGRGIKG